MRFIGPSRSFAIFLSTNPAVRRLFVGVVLFLPIIGCVSESTYEIAETEASTSKAELARTRVDIQALEQQKETLHKLNLEGETVLAGVRSELQKSREAYAQYKAELHNLEALRAKARTLRAQHDHYVQDIKASKKNGLKMQAVLDGYERELGQVADRTETFVVSKTFEPSADTSRVIATVQPLSSPSSSLPDPTSTQPQMVPPSTPPAPIASNSPVPSPSVTPAPAPAQPSQAVVVSANPTPTPAPQPPKADDSWMGSLTGWFSSIWDWLFS